MRVHEHDYVDQVVDMDFHDFDFCTFTRCKIVFHGYGAFKLTNCKLHECRFEFADATAQTIQMLTQLYHGGAKELVEATFENIRRGVIPPPAPPTGS